MNRELPVTDCLSASLRAPRARARLRRSRQCQREDASDVDRALHRDVASHCAREIPADRQAEARTFVLADARAAKLNERLEYRRELLGGHSDPVVLHAEANTFAVDGAAHLNAATRRRKLDRVRQQVERDLAEAPRVAATCSNCTPGRKPGVYIFD